VSVAYSGPGPATTLLRRRLPIPIRHGVGAKVAAAYIAILVLAAILAPLVARHDPNAINPLASYAGPSSGHLLGQDAAGRDIFSRLVYGARLSLLGPFAVVALSLVVGIPAGLIAGWRGGVIDALLSRITDALLAFPPLLLAIVIAATFGAGFRTAIIAITVTYIPLLMRVARGLTLVEREKTYIDELRCQGFSVGRITWLHVLPNIRRGIAAQATLSFGYALIDLAGLAFLGLGVQPPTADWGAMLSEGRQSLLINATEVTAAAVIIAVTVVAFNVLGDALTSPEQRQ
jgi:peptide/nickel transport system permease protein